jgi:hypothetical protein
MRSPRGDLLGLAGAVSAYTFFWAPEMLPQSSEESLNVAARFIGVAFNHKNLSGGSCG